MRFNELEITIKGSSGEEAPEVGNETSKYLKTVKYIPGQPKKSNQKKWQPPLQQLLDVLKAGIGIEKQTVDPTDPASKLAAAAVGADPALSVVEDQQSSINESIELCVNCGHLVFPQSLAESIGQEKISTLNEKWEKVAFYYTGGLPRCSNGCTAG